MCGATLRMGAVCPCRDMIGHVTARGGRDRGGVLLPGAAPWASPLRPFTPTGPTSVRPLRVSFPTRRARRVIARIESIPGIAPCRSSGPEPFRLVAYAKELRTVHGHLHGPARAHWRGSRTPRDGEDGDGGPSRSGRRPSLDLARAVLFRSVDRTRGSGHLDGTHALPRSSSPVPESTTTGASTGGGRDRRRHRTAQPGGGRRAASRRREPGAGGPRRPGGSPA